ncbi:MAG: hypothetical protein WEF50_14605 [Myxococcota bacterium]
MVSRILLPVLLLCAPAALAHTTIKSPASEGVRDDNAIRIGHGCGDEHGVIAQSVVFPTDVPELATSDPSVVVLDLSEVITQGGLAGLAQSIQDRSIFLSQTETLDANGNVVGLQARWGRLEPDLLGRVPFQFSAPSFVPESCAKRLLIQIAIADICSTRRPLLRPEKANLWIPDNGSAIANAALANGVEGVGAPATLTVNRNLSSNPLPAECGAGIDVTVTPSAAQVDRDLPIGHYWKAR